MITAARWIWKQDEVTGEPQTPDTVEVTEDNGSTYRLRYPQDPGTIKHEELDAWVAEGNTIEEADEFYGMTQQEAKAYVKGKLDDYYWPKYSEHENPFKLGSPIWPNGSHSIASATAEAKADRRSYQQGVEPAQDPVIDQVLASAEAYHVTMKQVYDATWSALKTQDIDWREIPAQPWPVTPDFVGATSPDEPTSP